jgi:hypothetical protein
MAKPVVFLVTVLINPCPLFFSVKLAKNVTVHEIIEREAGRKGRIRTKRKENKNSHEELLCTPHQEPAQNFQSKLCARVQKLHPQSRRKRLVAPPPRNAEAQTGRAQERGALVACNYWR